MEIENTDIVIDVNDILLSEEELTKFAIVYKNKESIVKILGHDDTNERIENLETLASALGLDYEMIYNSLFIARLIYLSNCEIDIEENDAE